VALWTLRLHESFGLTAPTCLLHLKSIKTVSDQKSRCGVRSSLPPDGSAAALPAPFVGVVLESGDLPRPLSKTSLAREKSRGKTQTREESHTGGGGRCCGGGGGGGGGGGTGLLAELFAPPAAEFNAGERNSWPQ